MQSEFDLFISYSSRDKQIADALLAGLEADGIRCWIAPRNVQPGKSWAGSILRGIRDADVFMLVLTEQSNQSNQVLNEVERAISLNKPIICYRAENVVLSDDLELFLSSKHWVEASGQPVGATLPMLTAAIRPLLAHRQAVSQPPPDEHTTPEEREEFLRNGKRAYLAQDFTLAGDYFNEAAEAGSGEALFYVGEMNRKGEGTKRTPAKARQLYKNAIDKGSALGNWGLARMLDEADELPDRARQYYEQAREAIAEKAVEEDAYCCYLYSLMYAEGKGVNKDVKRAERWLEKARDNGYKPIVTSPAKPTEEPRRIVPHPPAFGYLEPPVKPVTNSEPTAQRTVIQNPAPGTLVETTSPLQKFLIGLVTVGLITTFVTWYAGQDTTATLLDSSTDSTATMDTNSFMMADTTTNSATSYSDKSATELLPLAEAGDAEAQNWLGRKYDDGTDVPKDDQKAIEWYRKAADQGHAIAQSNLGIMYQYGEGVTKDASKAVEWYRKAADQGHADAQNSLGWMYDKGYGVTQSYSEAMKWYRKSAVQGDENAQNNLGWIYDKGHGVSKDYKKSVSWYQKAAEQGNAAAQNNLGIMYYEGKGVKQSYAKAAEWYRKSAYKGNPYGQYDLGDMYEYGKGVTKDIAEAKRLYKLAAAQGNEDAKSALKRLNGK